MAIKQNNKHVKKHNLHQDRSIRDFIGQPQWANQRTLFLIQHSVGHWYKSCEHARTNTTQLLQIAGTDELPIGMKPVWLKNLREKTPRKRERYERHRDFPKYP